jgi:chitin synthase
MSNLRSVANVSPSRDMHRQSQATLGYSGGTRAPLGHSVGHQSTASFDFQRGHMGPDDGMIVEAIQATLREVDLDTVTKKQVRALVEQRLQTELTGERRTFMDRQIDNELANM